MTPLKTASDVAAILLKSEDWVIRRTRRGEIPHVKVGKTIRYTDQHIEDYLAGLTGTPTAPAVNAWGRRTRASRAAS